MEQKYWEQFVKTGGVADYLGYKMEVYGHRREETGRGKQSESDHSDWDSAVDGAGRGI